MTRCPVCETVSARSYRCTECGKDLTDIEDDDDGDSGTPPVSTDGGIPLSEPAACNVATGTEVGAA